MVAVVPATVSLPLTVRQWDGVGSFGEWLERVGAEDRAVPFDRQYPPLLRFTVLTDGERRHRLLFTTEHILLDGWSIVALVRSVLRIYTDPVNEQARTVLPFRQVLEWIAEQDRAAAVARWHEYLADFAGPTLVGPRAGRNEAMRSRMHEFSTPLPQDLTESATAAARSVGVTLSTLMSASWGAALVAHTGVGDVCFGTVVSGRPEHLPGVEATIGLLFNTVPMRFTPSRAATRADVLRDTQRRALPAIRDSYVGLAEIVSGTGHRNLFDTLLVVQNHPRPAPTDAFGPTGELFVTEMHLHDATNYPMTVVIDPADTGLTLRVLYRDDAVNRETAERLVDRMILALRGFSQAPSSESWASLSLLLPEEQRAVSESAGVVRDVPDRSVADLLAHRVEISPDLRAVVSEGHELTYRDLSDRARRLANALRERGADSESRVLLLLPRTAAMVVAMFGVFEAHAAYVPVDSRNPVDRIAAIVRESAPTVVITDSVLAKRYAEILSNESLLGIESLLVIDGGGVPVSDSGSDEADTGREVIPRNLDNLAYVIYTSGSTGTPKGVAVSYRGLTNMFVNHVEKIFEPLLGRVDHERISVAHTTSFSFDASWEQLFWMLAGHEVHVLDDDVRRDPTAVLSYLTRHGIEALDVTPTYGEYLLRHGLLAEKSPLRFLSLGGEAVGQGLWSALRDNDRVSGYNLYGPTEYTINAVGADVADSVTPCIGKPIANTTALILDDRLQPVPSGTPGELYLCGVGTARGYLGQPGLSAERFVAATTGDPGQVMYRTGDAVVRRSDGMIDYLGRTDDQVKIRGHRIEPKEVEAVIAQHPDIAQVTVHGVHGGDGLTSLCAYLVLARTRTDTDEVAAGGSDEFDRIALREWIATRLPDYAVPASFTVIASIPLTINGKVDTKALPEPERGPVTELAPPEGDVETAIAECFADVLGVQAGRHTDFFGIGGHSLAAVTVASRLQERGFEVRVRDLYEHSTPARLAILVHRPETARAGASPTAPVQVLRVSETGPQVFCLPPAGGIAWSYRSMLTRLPQDWSLIALQDPRLSSHEQGLSLTVADEVRHYADTVRELHRDGDVRLVGWSYGGQLAHAVARELRADGYTIAAVALLDAMPPGRMPESLRRSVIEDQPRPFAQLAVLAGIDGGADLTDEAVIERIHSVDGPWAALSADDLGVVAHNLHTSDEERWVSEEPVEVDVVLFTAERDREPLLDQHQRSGWRSAVTGRLDVYPCDCEHQDMTTPAMWERIVPVLLEVWC